MSSISPHYSCPPPPLKVVPTSLSIMTKCFLDIFSIFAWQAPPPPPPPINALSENGLGKTLHSNFKCTTVNSISLRQIQIHHVTFAAAILNSLRQFQIRQGHFKFSTANSVSQECTYGLQGECGRGTARVGVGHHLSSIKCEIFT